VSNSEEAPGLYDAIKIGAVAGGRSRRMPDMLLN